MNPVSAPVGTLAGASTEYFDAHSIKVKIGAVEGESDLQFSSTFSTPLKKYLK